MQYNIINYSLWVVYYILMTYFINKFGNLYILTNNNE